MTNRDARADDAPGHDSPGAGSESPEEGAAAQQDADEASTTEGSPTGQIS
ncbi:hypothetical protein [Microbacterium testaceum]|nr:hypothetical protein [Microbacterium testaceum]WJS91877.1 hypothetical protein NYQ11_04795 [Microbacterium testaceum]